MRATRGSSSCSSRSTSSLHLSQRRCSGYRVQTVRHNLVIKAVNGSAADDTAPCPSGRQVADDITAAWSLLKSFSAAQFRGLSQQYVGTAAARESLRNALLLAYSHPYPAENWNPQLQPDVLLGVVASDSRLGLRALRDWCQTLNLEYVMPDCRVTGAASIATVAGAVYIKYNSVSKVCYLSQYKGQDSGVLIQLGQGPLLGHFPLGFFDEGMKNPAPSLDTPTSNSR